MSGGDFEGAGSPAASSLEPRVAKVEAAVEHIERDIADIKAEMRTMRANARGDFQLLFGATISVALGLAAIMAKGFRWF